MPPARGANGVGGEKSQPVGDQTAEVILGAVCRESGPHGSEGGDALKGADLSHKLAEQGSRKVEVQGSTPCGATGLILGVSSNGKTVGLHPANEGSTPSTVHCCCPGGERDIMAPSEGAGPGSTPGRGTERCPRSVPAARDRAKVEGEVRLLTGILAARPTDGGYGVVALHATL